MREPDIIVFDAAFAFVPSTDTSYPAVVVVEFKRPMRNDYDDDKKNPFVQVFGYVNDLRSKKAKTPKGRIIEIRDTTPFYCYIVCDSCSTLEKQARIANLIQTPDGKGFFGFNPNYNAYIEVISYDKMVEDANKRNAVLFDKLGLPSRVSLKDTTAMPVTASEEGDHRPQQDHGGLR